MPWEGFILRGFVAFLASAVICFSFCGQATAHPLNTWQVSCGADPGSIVKKGKTWIFRTSSNHCPGGTWKQRAELYTDRVAPNHTRAYRFSTTVAMTAETNEKFDIFQIHDGRRGCAPPIKVTVLPSGQIELTIDFKTGEGESCERGALGRSARANVIRRDGTPQRLEVIIDFNGRAGFDAYVRIDGVPQVSGTYAPPVGPQYFRSKFFYFKHGVYSPKPFPYVLTSEDMTVKRVRVSKP